MGGEDERRKREGGIETGRIGGRKREKVMKRGAGRGLGR